MAIILKLYGLHKKATQGLCSALSASEATLKGPTVCSPRPFLVSRAMALSLLTLLPSNALPHAVRVPNHNIIFVLLHNSNFATVLACDVNTFGGGGLPKGP